jgi:hypothetical protein
MTENFSNESKRLDEDAPSSGAGGRASGDHGWRSRIAAWRARLKQIPGRLRTMAGLTVVGALAGGGAVGAVLAVNPELLRPRVEAPVHRWGEAVVFPIEGRDLAGRKASFDLLLMPKDYTWVLGSSSELSFRGAPLSEAAAIEKIFTPEVRDGLSHSPEVIAVGVASQEGGLKSENERAGRRARTQAQLIAKSVSPLTRIWVLNLGRYNEACNAASAGDTSWQRPVIIVGVRFQDRGVVLAQALENAISGKSNVPSRECYSSFDMALSQ